MQVSELNPEFQRAIRKELSTDEQMVWWAHPDAAAVTRALLPFSVIWLSGLFLMSVAMLLRAPDDNNRLLHGLIFILIIVAIAGIFELIFVPRRAARTIYVMTNQRAFSMCVTKKLNVEHEEGDEKRVLKDDPSTPFGFYMSNLPSQLLLLLAGTDAVRALTQHMDIFLASGYGLILTGYMLPWINEMKLPIAKFREAPRVLYALQDMFITCQSLPGEQIEKAKLRRVEKELFNVVLISKNLGCLRFRAIPSKDKAVSLVELLTRK